MEQRPEELHSYIKFTIKWIRNWGSKGGNGTGQGTGAKVAGLKF